MATTKSASSMVAVLWVSDGDSGESGESGDSHEGGEDDGDGGVKI